MSNSDVLKKFAYAVLLLLFLYELRLAAKKLQSGQPSTSISRLPVTSLRIPDISFCQVDQIPYPKVRGFSTIIEQSRQFDTVKKLEFTNGKKPFDLFDPVVLSEYNISSREEILRSYYNVQLIGTNFAYIYSKCEAFLSFLDVPPSISDTFIIYSDAPMLLMFYEKDQWVSGFNGFLGKFVHRGLGDLNSLNRTATSLEVTRRHIEYLSRDGAECDLENKSKMRECIDEFVKKNLGCKLPWEQATVKGRICDTREDFDRFINLTERIYDMKTSLVTITEITGCVPNCRIVQYSTQEMGRFPYNGNVSAYSAGLVFSQQYVEEVKEIETYDLNNFVADTGGFLGLLLGFSAADLVRIAARLKARAKGRIRIV